jgi:hypothetical protein
MLAREVVFPDQSEEEALGPRYVLMLSKDYDADVWRLVKTLLDTYGLQAAKQAAAQAACPSRHGSAAATFSAVQGAGWHAVQCP